MAGAFAVAVLPDVDHVLAVAVRPDAMAGTVRPLPGAGLTARPEHRTLAVGAPLERLAPVDPALGEVEEFVRIRRAGGDGRSLLIGVTSSYPGMLAVPQEVPATVLGTIGAVVGGTVSAPGDVQFMTMAALLLLSGLLTGLLFLTVGHFRLSHLFRFIPYPVAGGFFAGSGWVLSLAALSVMSGVALDWHTLPQLFEPDMVWKWGPGAAYGLVLTVAMKQKGNFPVMMGSVVLVSALYHVGLLALDISVEDAKVSIYR